MRRKRTKEKGGEGEKEEKEKGGGGGRVEGGKGIDRFIYAIHLHAIKN